MHVSVVVPLHNKGKYVIRALDSIVAQTFVDFEVIVVDDGSTDNSGELARAYPDDERLLRRRNPQIAHFVAGRTPTSDLNESGGG